MSIRTELNLPPLFSFAEFYDTLGETVMEMAEEVGKEIDDAMENGPKTGNPNPRTGKNRSARFEPPAKDREGLLGSKSVERTGFTEATLEYTAPHAAILQSEEFERPILPDDKVPEWEARQASKLEKKIAERLLD